MRPYCEHVPQLEPLGNFLSTRGAEEEGGAGAASAAGPQRSSVEDEPGAPTERQAPTRVSPASDSSDRSSSIATGFSTNPSNPARRTRSRQSSPLWADTA